MKVAIYMIESTHAIYIGETVDIDSRLYRHHLHQDLAYKLLNIKERPTYKVLAYLKSSVDKSNRMKIEEEWLLHFRSFKNVVNTNEEVRRQKISKANKGHRRWTKGEHIKLIHMQTGTVIEKVGISNMARCIGDVSCATEIRKVIDGKRKSVRGWKLCE